MQSQPVLSVTDLVKHYAVGGVPLLAKRFGRTEKVLHALDGVSFDVGRDETLGVVGESGCGKTTLARTMLLLTPPTSGKVRFQEKELTALSKDELRKLRPKIQIVFQDPIWPPGPAAARGRAGGAGHAWPAARYNHARRD